MSVTLDWAAHHGRELNDLEREFLSKSRENSELEAERQRRANRRLRGLLVGTAIFLVLALVAGSLALVQRSHAREAQKKAEAQALRSDAERLGTLALTERDSDRSYLLAVGGVKLQDLPETRGDLLTVLQKSPGLIRLIHTSPSGVNSIAVSPDGRLLASGDSAGAVYFHDLGTWEQSGEPVRLEGAVTQQALVFSPDGRTLAAAAATGGNRANLYLVDVATRHSRKIGSWPSIPSSGGPLRFTLAAFSPDGTRIAVAVATSRPPLPIPAEAHRARTPGGGFLIVAREGWDRVLYDVALRSLFASHNGEVAHHTGDGFFAAFVDARSALDCAVSIQRALADHRRAHGFAPAVRIGVHAAKATRRGQDYSGKEVHKAARIAALAGGGEILASVETASDADPAIGVLDAREVALEGCVLYPVTNTFDPSGLTRYFW